MTEMENFSVSQLLENVESSIRMRNLPELNSQIDMVLHTYHDLKSAFNKLCKKRSIQTFDEDDKVSDLFFSLVLEDHDNDVAENLTTEEEDEYPPMETENDEDDQAEEDELSDSSGARRLRQV